MVWMDVMAPDRLAFTQCGAEPGNKTFCATILGDLSKYGALLFGSFKNVEKLTKIESEIHVCCVKFHTRHSGDFNMMNFYAFETMLKISDWSTPRSTRLLAALWTRLPALGCEC